MATPSARKAAEMPLSRSRVLLVIALFVAAIGALSIWHKLGPLVALDETGKQDIVTAVARSLRDGYVDPEVGERTAEAIESALAGGGYDGIDKPQAFADRLTEDMRAVAHDEHLRIIGPDDERVNPGTGVSRADILDGNVGFLEVRRFPPTDAFDQAVQRAMEALEDTRALIVDVRQNAGGGGTARLVSYFLAGDEPVLIHTVFTRVDGTDEFTSREVWSEKTPLSYVGRPVYVLTSTRTFSAGEGFAYQMQAMDLAEVVGETTRGGGHNGGIRPVAGLLLFLPVGRGENPITGTNWEGVGVVPDIPASSADALRVALEHLGLSPESSEIEALSRSRVF